MIKCSNNKQVDTAIHFGWLDKFAKLSFDRRQDSSLPVAYSTAKEPTADADWTYSPWFMGGIKRDVAVFMLQSTTLGCFLIRENCTSPGEFVLSMRGSSSVEHIRVVRGRGGYGLGSSAIFESVLQLVNYYREHSLKEQFDEIDSPLTGWPSKEKFVATIQSRCKIRNCPPFSI